MSLNLYLFQELNNLVGRSPALDRAIIFSAQFLPWVLAAGLVWWLARQSPRLRPPLFLGLLASGGLAWLAAIMIQTLYFHPRPWVVFAGAHSLLTAGSNSFPSAHAAFFFAIGVFIYRRGKAWGRLYLAGAVLISLARVAAGLHWPADIAGGLALGFLAAGLVELLVRTKLKYKY